MFWYMVHLSTVRFAVAPRRTLGRGLSQFSCRSSPRGRPMPSERHEERSELLHQPVDQDRRHGRRPGKGAGCDVQAEADGADRGGERHCLAVFVILSAGAPASSRLRPSTISMPMARQAGPRAGLRRSTMIALIGPAGLTLQDRPLIRLGQRQGKLRVMFGIGPPNRQSPYVSPMGPL